MAAAVHDRALARSGDATPDAALRRRDQALAQRPAGPRATATRHSTDVVLHFGLAPIVVEAFDRTRQPIHGVIDDLHRGRGATPLGFRVGLPNVGFQGLRWTFGVLLSSYPVVANPTWTYAQSRIRNEGTVTLRDGWNHPSWDIGIVQNLTAYRGEFTYGAQPVVVATTPNLTLLDSDSPAAGTAPGRNLPWVWPDGATRPMGSMGYWHAQGWTTLRLDAVNRLMSFGPPTGGPGSVWLYFSDSPSEGVPLVAHGGGLHGMVTQHRFRFWVLAIPSSRSGLAPQSEYRRLMMSNEFTAEYWLPNIQAIRGAGFRIVAVPPFTAGGPHAARAPHDRPMRINVGMTCDVAPVIGGPRANDWLDQAFAAQQLRIP